MNEIGHNRAALNETVKTLEMLKLLPDYQNRTDEELYRISESIKELSLLLRMIYMEVNSPDHES